MSRIMWPLGAFRMGVPFDMIQVGMAKNGMDITNAGGDRSSGNHDRHRCIVGPPTLIGTS